MPDRARRAADLARSRRVGCFWRAEHSEALHDERKRGENEAHAAGRLFLFEPLGIEAELTDEGWAETQVRDDSTKHIFATFCLMLLLLGILL